MDASLEGKVSEWLQWDKVSNVLFCIIFISHKKRLFFKLRMLKHEVK
jgi:hypothetical protein